MEPILNILSLIIGVACYGIWIYALVHTDEPPKCSGEEDPEICETCPFPCDRHKG